MRQSVLPDPILFFEPSPRPTVSRTAIRLLILLVIVLAFASGWGEHGKARWTAAQVRARTHGAPVYQEGEGVVATTVAERQHETQSPLASSQHGGGA